MLKWIKANSKVKGDFFESVAQQYLTDQGLTALASNFHSRFGEIDLIMQDGKFLVFIEVKYRNTDQFANPLEHITLSKQKKITKTAKFFLLKQGLNEYNSYCRFDVVSITGPSNEPKIIWLKNAFYGA